MTFDEGYVLALGDMCMGYEALRPPKRVSVSQGAHDALVIQQPGAAGGSWSADETPYMVEPMDVLASRQHEASVFVGPARTGKCLDIETPVPTPSGWVRMIDLKEGDYVYGPDGKPTKVLVAHAVLYDLPCYEVTFSDGSSLVTDSEHLWGVERFYGKAPNWRYEVRSTESMVSDFKYGGNRNRYHVKNTKPIEAPERPLWIDPYILGVWLGNGGTLKSEIHSHTDDVAHYESEFRKAGYAVDTRLDKGNVWCTRIDMKGVEGDDYAMGRFIERLRFSGLLGRKHIPEQYLRASVEQRTALLQGLMDTDGFAGGDCRAPVEFSTTVTELADGFVELCRSLGFKPVCVNKQTTWTHNGERRYSTAWRISFSVDNDVVPFRLPRKRDSFRRATAPCDYRAIVDIKRVATRPVRCIAVDNESKLFLAGKGFIPTHNTAGLLLGWMAHNVVNDPGDMLFIQMTKDKAREFSKTDVDRAIRNSPKIQALKGTRAIDSNTFDSMFRHGMFLRIAWPTVSNVSGSTYRYVGITDLDRMENAENVDGEGPLFDLARKRTTTFLSRGMCLAESSPGIEVEVSDWKPHTPHEGPPVKGIVGIYNRSDRRRWYWRCPDCHEGFEAAPGLGLFNLPGDEELIESVRSMSIPKMAAEWGSRVVCPHCGSIIDAKWKTHLNRTGKWLAEGQILDVDGNIIGERPPASIAGFWLGGVAAAYQKWSSLVERYLQGLREYALNGSEEVLKTTVNTDQGMPYTSRHLIESQSRASAPEDRGDDTLKRFVVPPETRCLTAAVDVQGGTTSRFIVQVHAVGPHMEQWLVDRFEIRYSKREGMGGEFAPIDPAAYPEDWDLLTDKLLLATWQTPTAGREIKLKMLTVDTGGEEGVTHNAYAWYRRVRQLRLGNRVMLYKGASEPKAPILKESMVGKRHAKSKADVPLYVCNPNLLSDAVNAGLNRPTPGPNYIHFPPPKHPNKNPDGWLTQAFFDELKAEVRQPNGTYKQVRKRNESIDLCRMIRAGLLKLGLDKIKDWSAVPAWLTPLDQNSEVVSTEDRREMKVNEVVSQVEQPAPPVRIVRPRAVKKRRSAPSPYLR